MRSIMNGSLSFALVTLPIKLYSAIEDTEMDSHQVHAHDGGKVEYRKVCAECNTTVATRDIAKKYIVDDQTVILTADDLSQIEAEKTRELAVLEFVPAGSIRPEAYEKPYFIGPADTAGMKTYALLVDTLTAAERVAIVQFTLRGRTRLGALGVTGKGILILNALRWSEEIRQPVLPALDTSILDRKREELTDAERDTAARLVESMATDTFNPDKYRDEYAIELRELVMSKIDDETAPDDVSDLLAKLSASVAKKPCKADIRTWARSQGIAIGNRGRVPKDIVDRFERATA